MTDRLPPFDQDAEMAVIGACLESPATSVPEISQTIPSPEVFYDLRCRSAWDIISGLNPHEVEVISLCGKIQDMDHRASGVFLSQCVNQCSSAAFLSSWLEIICGKYFLRRVIQVASLAVRDAYAATDVLEVMDAFERDVMAIRPAKRQGQSITELVRDAMAEIEDRFTRQGTISGLSTGLHDLDLECDGLHGGEIIVIAAFPSFGKTALAMNIVEHVALDCGKAVGIFSAEMSAKSLVIRCLCSRGRINLRDVRDGKLAGSDFSKLMPASSALAASKMVIDDTCGLTTSQLRQRARQMKQAHGIELLVADYAQLFASSGAENRTNEVDQVSKCFKGIAKELNIPVILLSQLTDTGNGGVRTKNAAAIEEDADGLWLLRRPKDAKDSPDDLACAMELWLKKQRNGPRNVCINLTFLKPYTRFELAPKIEREYQNPTND